MKQSGTSRRSHLLMALPILVSFLLLNIQAAASQEALGLIEAQIGDEQKTWFLTAEGKESQSSWSKMMPTLIDVSLWGHASPDSISSFKGALLLDFSVMLMGSQMTVMDPALQYFENGYKNGWKAEQAENLEITLDTAQVTEAGLSIKGNFTATASFSENLMQGEIDPSRTLQIQGRFEAKLPGK